MRAGITFSDIYSSLVRVDGRLVNQIINIYENEIVSYDGATCYRKHCDGAGQLRC
jgi:hypothetical protein